MKTNNKLLAIVVVSLLMFALGAYADDENTVVDSVKDVSRSVSDTSADAVITAKIIAVS